MSLEENIKNWVRLDNYIKELNEKIKYYKQEKVKYNTNIIEYITNNDLDNVTIRISDGKIKFLDMNYSQPLTYKFIYECLIKFFNNENTVDEIINFIKSERNIKTIKEIKRFNN